MVTMVVSNWFLLLRYLTVAHVSNINAMQWFSFLLSFSDYLIIWIMYSMLCRYIHVKWKAYIDQS